MTYLKDGTKSQVQKTISLKIDKIIEITINDFEIQRLYTAFMFHKKNPNYEKLIRIYNKIEELLNTDK